MKLSLTIVLAAVASTSALTSPTDRRGAFKNLLGAGAGAFLVTAMPQAASATAAKTGAANPFSGDYNDPNHPECLRQVKVVGAPLKGDGTRSPYPVIEVVGYDGKGGKVCTDRPTRDDLWKVEGTVKGPDTAFIDFSAKGGPEKLLAKYEDGGIVFPDGNKWTKVARGTPDRRPADMSTLKSE
mmetsp:Transcript_20419/g.50759  ORF Transcript_20419/g.50759 Transcript_20419/m.50759 type:complete len:183 (+) Transcript_20419:59-607(+)